MELEDWIFATCFVAAFPSAESAFIKELEQFKAYRIRIFCELRSKLSETACATFLDKIVHAERFSFCTSNSKSSCFDAEDGKANDAVSVMLDELAVDMRRNEAHFLYVVYCFLHFGRVVKTSPETDLEEAIKMFFKINDYIRQVTLTLD